MQWCSHYSPLSATRYRFYGAKVPVGRSLFLLLTKITLAVLCRLYVVQVNVRDNVMWQTPLHCVFLSAQRATHGANVSDVEELVLWLVRV